MHILSINFTCANVNLWLNYMSSPKFTNFLAFFRLDVCFIFSRQFIGQPYKIKVILQLAKTISSAANSRHLKVSLLNVILLYYIQCLNESRKGAGDIPSTVRAIFPLAWRSPPLKIMLRTTFSCLQNCVTGDRRQLVIPDTCFSLIRALFIYCYPYMNKFDQRTQLMLSFVSAIIDLIIFDAICSA